MVRENTTALWLKRISRISAWLLLVSVVVLLVSGWGITQTDIIYKASFGLIDRRLADAIHRASILPLAFFFLLHVLVNIRLKLHSKNPYLVWFTNGILAAIGGSILALVVYMEYFRVGG
jgi:cytochrome b subunit of formate dehydrogenase